MYGREKLTIKGRFFNVCFLKKKLSGPKDRSFTPPENLPGEGLKHTFIREKWRFSAVGGNGGLSSNLPPKRKNRPEDRSVENFENGGGGGSRTRVPTRSNEDVYMLISSLLFIVLCRSR